MAEWFVDAFRADYLDLYAHRDETDARRALDLFRAAGDAAPVELNRILDCACGAGRHLNLLIDEWPLACGIDLSRDLLRHGAAGWTRSTAMPVACADMRHLPFGAAAFDAVLSLFTSFGYFDDPDDDRRFLTEVARILRPGGLYFFDFLNADAVRANLNPQSERILGTGERLIEERRIDEPTQRVIKKVTRIHSNGDRREWIESVRLYDSEQMTRLMEGAGLKPERLFGDYDGSPHAPGAPRLIIAAFRE